MKTATRQGGPVHVLQVLRDSDVLTAVVAEVAAIVGVIIGIHVVAIVAVIAAAR